jgi:hypothetical protein
LLTTTSTRPKRSIAWATVRRHSASRDRSAAAREQAARGLADAAREAGAGRAAGHDRDQAFER